MHVCPYMERLHAKIRKKLTPRHLASMKGADTPEKEKDLLDKPTNDALRPDVCTLGRPPHALRSSGASRESLTDFEWFVGFL